MNSAARSATKIVAANVFALMIRGITAASAIRPPLDAVQAKEWRDIAGSSSLNIVPDLRDCAVGSR